MSTEEATAVANVPNKRKIAVWTLPQGSSPAIRVEVSGGRIIASRLLEIAFDTLGIQERSRPFFALFKDLDPPTKKFGEDEIIYVPYKSVISLQKWSFDPIDEAKAIKTDVVSIRLLALQINADINSGRLPLTAEEKVRMDELMDPEFPCYKQYVESARSVESYGSVVIKDVKLVSNIRLKTQTIKKGHKIDIVCNNRKMIIITEKRELHIPWRKVRRWTQISGHASIGYEIYLMEEKAFTWIEVETNQVAYLLQVTCELVGRMKTRMQRAEFKKPAWALNSATKKKLTWKMFKKEVFGIGEEPEPQPVFDNIAEEASSSDEDDDNDVAGPSRKCSRSNRSAGAYLVQKQ